VSNRQLTMDVPLREGAPKWKDAAARLLKRPSPDDYTAECTAHVARPRTDTTRTGTKAVVIFSLGKEWLGLPAELLQEVSELWPIRTVPHRRGSVVKGVINIRGELVVCISLPILLGTDSAADANPAELVSRQRLLVLNRQGGRFAFQVDQVCGVQRYHPSELSTPPATLTKSSAFPLTQGILRWNGHSVGCLAEEVLLHALDRGAA
jgi:chemotaxis-related protein WspD